MEKETEYIVEKEHGDNILVVKNNNSIRKIIVDITNAEIFGEDEIIQILSDIFNEQIIINDFLSVEREAFIKYKEDEFIYLDHKLSLYNDNKKDCDALNLFINQVKRAIKENSNHCIVKFVGERINIEKIRIIIQLLEEEMLEKNEINRSFRIDLGINFSQVGKPEDILLLCFFGRGDRNE